jgi:tetratricopeptide (TPR) repeat protein
VGAALVQEDDDGGAAGEPAGRRPPALELSVLGGDPEARALRAAESAYERGRRAEARHRFEALLQKNPNSLEAAVGAAVAAWPNGVLPRLRALARRHPDSALVHLHVGLALFAAGRREAAEAEWRQAEGRDPDSPAAVRSEDLLHPDMAPGRPIFVADLGPRAGVPPGLSAQRQLRILERRAERGGEEDWIVYGIALQRSGRPLSARAAYERAGRLDPDDVADKVAAAIARFDKDDPAQAFSRLGPLAREHPRAAVVRFHLGLLLLWIRAIDEAREQLRLARRADSRGFYGREAAEVLRRLAKI